MKKLLAIMAIAAIGFTSCKKDKEETPVGSLSVEKMNRGILIDFSETWCPPCGSSGGPGFDACIADEGTKITAIKIYGSSTPSSLNCSVRTSFKNAYAVSGIPDFYFNTTGQNAGGGVYSSVSANYNWMLNKANVFAADSVVAGVALSKAIVGDSIKVTTKVKFFKAQPAGSTYTLGVYVLEDHIIAPQEVSGSGLDSNYVHRNLVRTSNSTNYYGLPLNAAAAITEGQEFENSYMMAKNAAWKVANLKAVAVIWKSGSTPNKVVNSNVAK